MATKSTTKGARKSATKTASKTKTRSTRASRGSNEKASVGALLSKAKAFGGQAGATASTFASAAGEKVSTFASTAGEKVSTTSGKVRDYIKSHPKEAAGIAIATLSVVTAWMNRGKIKKANVHQYVDPIASKAVQLKDNLKDAVEKSFK